MRIRILTEPLPYGEFRSIRIRTFHLELIIGQLFGVAIRVVNIYIKKLMSSNKPGSNQIVQFTPSKNISYAIYRLVL